MDKSTKMVENHNQLLLQWTLKNVFCHSMHLRPWNDAIAELNFDFPVQKMRRQHTELAKKQQNASKTHAKRMT